MFSNLFIYSSKIHSISGNMEVKYISVIKLDNTNDIINTMVIIIIIQ